MLRRRRDHELDAEIHAHFRMAVEERLARVKLPRLGGRFVIDGESYRSRLKPTFPPRDTEP